MAPLACLPAPPNRAGRVPRGASEGTLSALEGECPEGSYPCRWRAGLTCDSRLCVGWREGGREAAPPGACVGGTLLGCSAGQEEFWERRGGRRAHLGRMGGRPRPGCAWGEGTPWTAGSRPGGHGELQPLTENREPHVGGSGEEAAGLQILLAQTRAVPGGRGEGEGCSEWPPEPPGHPSEHSQKCQLASSP